MKIYKTIVICALTLMLASVFAGCNSGKGNTSSGTVSGVSSVTGNNGHVSGTNNSGGVVNGVVSGTESIVGGVVSGTESIVGGAVSDVIGAGSNTASNHSSK